MLFCLFLSLLVVLEDGTLLAVVPSGLAAVLRLLAVEPAAELLCVDNFVPAAFNIDDLDDF